MRPEEERSIVIIDLQEKTWATATAGRKRKHWTEKEQQWRVKRGLWWVKVRSYRDGEESVSCFIMGMKMMMLIRQLRGGRRRRQSRSKYKDGHGAWGTLHADLLLVCSCTLRYTSAFIFIQSSQELLGSLQVSEDKNDEIQYGVSNRKVNSLLMYSYDKINSHKQV